MATAIGVMAGAIVGVVADDRQPARGVVTDGLLCAVLGFVGSYAWNTRPLTSGIVRGAGKRIRPTRDQHWLVKNPVIFG